MSQTPFEHSFSLQIGTVDFVSSDEIKVVLDIETPESVTLNSGGPRPFPRVNSYALIPVDDGFLVGQIVWLAVERSAFPKRGGMKDFGLVDLPYPLRKLSLNPLGTLRKNPRDSDKYIFQRGADALPSVGSAVLLPTDLQLRSIVESGDNRRVKIGISPLAGNAEVRIDPNRLFGRHLAVLGNTGSGKSCSIAGLIRWNLEQAQEISSKQPNARFIILDPNGEYTRAFSDFIPQSNVRIFKVNPDKDEETLKVPLWLWNSTEWSSFTQASPKTQRPTLIHALRYVKEGKDEPVNDSSHEMRVFLRTIVSTIQIEKKSGNPWGSFPRSNNFHEKLEKWKKGLEPNLYLFSGETEEKLKSLIEYMESLCEPRRIKYAHCDFTLQEINNLIQLTSDAHSAFGGSDSDGLPLDVDAPCQFDEDALLRSIEAVAEMLNVSDHVETLLIRIRTLLTDVRMKPILSNSLDITLEEWLSDYIGSDKAENGCISVIDLSLVPTEVVHILTAVIARMIFESLQRYMKINNSVLPTVLVMDEAHNFIKRYNVDVESHDTAIICCHVFEKIAREGRKFGLGLVLSSQRPSELSPTVLSQCNTFLLHRITNDRDQELVHRLVPDNLKGLLRELPLLPSQNGILLGWASELPVLVKMNDLPLSQQPRSADPDFWGSWIGEDEEGHEVLCEINWSDISEDWQGQKIDKDQPGGDCSL